MKFYEPWTSVDAARGQAKAAGQKLKGGHDYVYARMTTAIEQWHKGGTVSNADHNAGMNQMIAEWKWHDDGQPYYLVYPGLIPLFERIKLDAIPTDVVDEKMRQLGSSVMLRFAEGRTGYVHDGGELRTVLLTFHEVPDTQGHRVVMMHAWNGCKAPQTGLAMGTFTIIPVSCGCPDHQHENHSIEEALTSRPAMDHDPDSGEPWTPDLARQIARIAIGVLLLADEMLEPDVLSKDKGKPVTQAIIDRARRRGKRGWHVGRQIEHVPHWRRPHLAWVRCGKGRANKRLVMRAGSVVHRAKVKDIPTGYGSDEAENEC